MDKKTKIFFLIFFTLIAGVVAVTFIKFFVAKDYIIEAQADCDPTIDKCFIWNCDPNSDVEGEKCTGDPETDIWYYQKVKKLAGEIPDCDPNDENCSPWECLAGMDCSVTFCDASEGEADDVECNDPEKYNEEHPVIEEECAPDDEECINSEGDEETCSPDDESCMDSEELDDGGSEDSPEENIPEDEIEKNAPDGEESAVKILNSIS